MIRIAITQPDIRPYRLPVYNLLAAQPDIEVTLFADQASDAPNPVPDTVKFGFEHANVRNRRIGPAAFREHPAQIEVVDPDRFDLLIHSWNPRYLTLRPALKKAKRAGLPTVAWGHGYSKSDTWLRTWMRNRLGRLATGVMLYTHPVAERLVSEYGFDRERVFVAQNAIDQTPIQQARQSWLARSAELAAFQAEQRLDPSRTVAFVSRLRDENRPDRLLRAIANGQSELPGLTAVVVGDGPERSNLEAQARELGIVDQVRFAGAVYDEHDLAPWLLSSGVFCYPENVGLSLLTALGFGLPAITSDDIEAQNPEIVALKPGENGLLYPYGDEPAMTNAIVQILSDAQVRERMAAEALRTVTEEFTLPTMVQGFLDATRLVDGVQRTVCVPE
ncbi:glycosyltransferase family 4 protein [Aeoliella sp. ICT_H6.2]|uniref:Glycosyltransferase family 4 protein n=1 Tax=Aeoliella straminimaris TaxID=2954799 RepID=A0A9X2JF02_9BACT|nr:glycosyltransferase family 4 protein [Aeoliella straminimaris]MCO6043196.1 glycosyltransferase family 4 protein [Aeoliella straminimaris]